MADKMVAAYSIQGYDRRGDAKFPVGRDVDPGHSAVEGVPAAVRDEALTLLCESVQHSPSPNVLSSSR